MILTYRCLGTTHIEAYGYLNTGVDDCSNPRLLRPLRSLKTEVSTNKITTSSRHAQKSVLRASVCVSIHDSLPSRPTAMTYVIVHKPWSRPFHSCQHNLILCCGITCTNPSSVCQVVGLRGKPYDSHISPIDVLAWTVDIKRCSECEQRSRVQSLISGHLATERTGQNKGMFEIHPALIVRNLATHCTTISMQLRTLQEHLRCRRSSTKVHGEFGIRNPTRRNSNQAQQVQPWSSLCHSRHGIPGLFVQNLKGLVAIEITQMGRNTSLLCQSGFGKSI